MKTVNVVAGVVFKDSKVLCVQRGSHKFDYISNKFEFPGGKVKSNETEKKALQRELLEELNIDVDVNEKLITVEHQYPDFKIHMKCYRCSANSSDIELREHISMKFLKIKDLLQLEWLAADIPVVNYLMKDVR